MNDFLERVSHLSPKQLALLAARLQEKLDAQETAEPIACIGIGCRFPGGVRTPEAYWQLLTEGKDAIIPIPKDRWDAEALYDANPDAAGKIATKHGGFLETIDRFDAELFGISAREARSMDPQQRQLLEVSWESVERAGYGPDQLMGSSTGVFFGISNFDYAILQLRQAHEQLDAYVASGCSAAVAAGRLSYVLGLLGPCLTVDTACSSSLVATHLACQSLRAGECQMALAGGANLILSPVTTIALSRAHMMAPDGRCKAFDASADGFVRSEGVGVIVLKRLADALNDGDPIVAVLRGSAINQDGRSNGLTAPSGPSQEEVIHAALRQAQRSTSDIGYVEAHGTGTSLGDPIEIRALDHVFSSGRSKASPLIVGSVKSNIGHCESAAGIAGLIKAMLVVHYGQIPRSLHYGDPNPHVNWDEMPIRVADRLLNWSATELPPQRLAGVSSFGFGGTNAHVIVEQPPLVRDTQTDSESENPERQFQLLTLSAQSEDSIQAFAERWLNYLTKNPRTPLSILSRTMSVGHAHLLHRMAFAARDITEVITKLQAVTDETTDTLENVTRGKVKESDPAHVAFVFPNNVNSSFPQAQTLYDSAKVFRSIFDHCDELFQQHLNICAKDLLLGRRADRATGDPALEQQAIVFSMQYALACQLQSWGIRPLVVSGHGLGRYVAACVAGIFSLENAIRLVAIWLAEKQLSIHTNTAATFPKLKAVFDETTFLTPQIEIVGNASDEHDLSSAAYWLQDATQANDLEARIKALANSGANVFLEITTDPQQSTMFESLLRLPGSICVSSLNGEQDTWIGILEALSQFYCRGLQIDWRAFHELCPADIISGPTYPFRPDRYWFDDSLIEDSQTIQSLGVNESTTLIKANPPIKAILDRDHRMNSLPGVRLNTPAPNYQAVIDCQVESSLFEHVVNGQRIATGFICLETACEAVQREYPDLGDTLSCHLELHQPLIFPQQGHVSLHTSLTRQGKSIAFTLHSRLVEQENSSWTHIASGNLSSAPALTTADPAIEEKIQRFQTGILDIKSSTGDEIYTDLRSLGIELGHSQQGLKEVWRSPEEAWARLRITPLASSSEVETSAALLDAALHALGAWIRFLQPDQKERLAFSGIETVTQSPVLSNVDYWVEVKKHQGSSANAAFVADLNIYRESGECVATIHGAQFKNPRTSDTLPTSNVHLDECVYSWKWVDAPWKDAISAESQVLTVSSTNGQIPYSWQSCSADDFKADMNLLADEHGLAEFVAHTVPTIDDAALGYMHAALKILTNGQDLNKPLLAEELRTQLNVNQRHARLFAYLLKLLEAQGILHVEENRYSAGAKWNGTPNTPSQVDLIKSGADARPEMVLTTRCGENLPAVLKGETDPVSLLFPGGDISALTSIYATSPTAQVTHQIAKQIVRQLLAGLPNGKTITVLEIGAGTGATTESLLDLFPPDRTRYIFTDVSPVFLETAKTKFADYQFVEYYVLDIETGQSSSGLEVQADLVIAANVLHATADLKECLTHAANRMAAGGRLLLIEGEQRHPWVDVTFGLTEGWWRFRDSDRRSDYPLMDAENWIKTFSEVGFQEIESLPIGLSANNRADQRLWWATAPDLQNQPAKVLPSQRSQATRHWLVSADKAGDGGRLAAALEKHNCHCLLVRSSDNCQRISGHEWALDPLSHDQWQEVFDDASAHGIPITDIAFCWNSADLMQPVKQVDRRSDLIANFSVALISLVQFVQKQAGGDKVRIHLVTRGAQVQGKDAKHLNLDSTCLWGLGRGIVAEHPNLWGCMIDLPVEMHANDANLAARQLLAEDGEDEISFSTESRRLARWQRGLLSSKSMTSLRADRSYLITGGLGGVGLLLAQWLADHGAKYITLAARRVEFLEDSSSSAGADAREKIAALRNSGVNVTVRKADISQSQDISELMTHFGTEDPLLAGVFHLAASIQPSSVMDLDIEALQAMYRSKIDGAWLLHEHTLNMQLDHFVLFSSTTALLGASGLSHYAAANQFLDGLAHWRRAQGLPALAINWGTWSEMQRASTSDRSDLAAGGLLSLPADTCLTLLGRAMEANLTQTTIALIDWQRLKPLYESRRKRSILSEISNVSESNTSHPNTLGTPSSSETLQATLKLPLKQRRLTVESFLKQLSAEILGGNDSSGVDIDRGLFEMGMDSLMSVQFKSKLEAALAKPLPATLTFNYPTIRQLTDFVLSELSQSSKPEESIARDSMLSPASTPTSNPKQPETASGKNVLPPTSGGKLSAQFAERLRRLQ